MTRHSSSHAGHAIGMATLGRLTLLWCATCRVDIAALLVPTAQEAYANLLESRRN